MRRTTFCIACLYITLLILVTAPVLAAGPDPAAPLEATASSEPAPEIFAAPRGFERLDPCAVGEFLARLPACLRSEDCQAHKLWDRLVGEPGLRVATPEGPGPDAIRPAGQRRGASDPVLRLPGGGEPSAARGPAGNLDEVRLLFGSAYPDVRDDVPTAPPLKPCPAVR